MSGSGVASQRAVRAEGRFLLPDQAGIKIRVESSAALTILDKVRVETDFGAVVLGRDFIKEAVEAGDYTLDLSLISSVSATSLGNGALTAAAIEGAGMSVRANKPVSASYGLSSKASVFGTPSVVDEAGAVYAAKENPARRSVDYTVSGSKASASYALRTATKDFSDIANLDQAMQDSIRFLASQGIINGMTATAFEPETPITRGQLAQILVTSLSLLDPSADGGFADLPAGDWARAAAGSAKKHGIINGYDDGTFRSNAVISKDQIVAMAARTLWSQMNYKEQTEVESYLSPFTDSASIPGWARGDVAKAVKTALFPSSSSGAFMPASSMTRGDAALIVKRLFDKLWL
jgi:hypothetical protein